MKLLILVLAIVATGAGALHSWHSRDLYVKAAQLSEAFNLTSPVKLRVADYYVKHGVMPHDNADAELPAPKSIYGASVKRVAINRGGVLIVDFDETIGNRSMTFTPSVSPVSGLLDWNCTSDSIKPAVLQRLKPSCGYLPATSESRLMSAIANKDLPQVDALLAAGAQPEAVVNGNTPLMLAAKIGELSIVERVLDAGAQVDNGALSQERRSPLMVAITSNHSEVASLLLSRGASVIRKDYRGMTAMDHAVATDRRLGGERYVLMLAARFNPQFAGSEQVASEKPVSADVVDAELRGLYVDYRRAVESCHVKRISSLLLEQNDKDSEELVNGEPLSKFIKKPACIAALDNHIQAKTSYQLSAQAFFTNQVQKCHITQIQRVMQDNPALSVQQVYRGRTHLNRAVSAGCAEVVRMMIRDGQLAAELPEHILVTAILQAPQASLVKLVGNLITVGANVNGRDRQGQTPLAAAISLEQPVVAKYLVDAGADVNAITFNRSYPIIEATKKGHEHLVIQMLGKGANVDAADSLGRTALLAAVSQDRHRLVESLIRAGANTTIRDANGISASVLAESRNQRQIRKLLTASAE